MILFLNKFNGKIIIRIFMYDHVWEETELNSSEKRSYIQSQDTIGLRKTDTIWQLLKFNKLLKISFFPEWVIIR